MRVLFRNVNTAAQSGIFQLKLGLAKSSMRGRFPKRLQRRRAVLSPGSNRCCRDNEPRPVRAIAPVGLVPLCGSYAAPPQSGLSFFRYLSAQVRGATPDPNVARWTRRKSAGHHRFVLSSLSVNMLIEIASPRRSIDSTSHALVRTNPWAGAAGSSDFARNQGKQMGMPPRMAWPSSHCEHELRKRTSSAPAGFHEVTCAPCRYISPDPAGEVIDTFGSPPLPARISARPGIPKRRFSSVILFATFMLILCQ